MQIDMAGGMQDGEQPDADSFAGELQAAGYQPECVIRGIGEYPAVPGGVSDSFATGNEKIIL